MAEEFDDLIPAFSPDRSRKLVPKGPAEWAERWNRYEIAVKNQLLAGTTVFIGTKGILQSPVAFQTFGITTTRSRYFEHISREGLIGIWRKIYGSIVPVMSPLPIHGFADLVSIYEPESLNAAEKTEQPTEYENLLAEASNNRDLVATLVEKNWLGLKLLIELRNSTRSSITQLGSKVLKQMRGDELNSLAVTLVRLVRHGVVDVKEGSFVCTDRGNHVVQALEKAAGVAFGE